ncbi:MAG: hypothetical protein OXI25_03820 [Chloroflexota bacterium]|nr:hypothetical protein [Chloroflexota bacterium]
MRGLLLLLATLTVMLAVACGSDPTPTPTATPEPTPTPAPTATPTPAAPPAFEVNADTLGRDVIDLLTDAEVDCIRERLGEADFQRLLDDPIVGGSAGDAALPYECLEEETAMELAVAVVSAQAGGLSAQSEDCVRRLLLGADGGASALFAAESNSDAESIALTLNFILCLTDEEAEALAEQPEDFEDFNPSALRCATERVSVEELARVFGAADGAFPAISPEMIQVFADCGFGDAPDGPPGDAFTLEQLQALAAANPSLQPLVDCLEENATPEAIAEFFAGLAVAPPEGVLGCLFEYGHLLEEALPSSGG